MNCRNWNLTQKKCSKKVLIYAHQSIKIVSDLNYFMNIHGWNTVDFIEQTHYWNSITSMSITIYISMVSSKLFSLKILKIKHLEMVEVSSLNFDVTYPASFLWHTRKKFAHLWTWYAMKNKNEYNTEQHVTRNWVTNFSSPDRLCFKQKQ